MNPKITAGSRCPAGEEGRGFSQDLALLGEDPVLAAQPPQLLALIRGQALGLALVDVEPDATSCAATAASTPAPARAAAPTGRSSSAAGPPRGGTPTNTAGSDGMDIDPRCRARRPSDQVSTKPGELHRAERAAALAGWIWTYNRRRPHGALSHKPPIARLNELNNLPGPYT